MSNMHHSALALALALALVIKRWKSGKVAGVLLLHIQ